MNEQETILHGREIIELEARALEQLAELLDQRFAAAVELVLNRTDSGRLVVSGMGKAGFVAMKISATFASTGVPSYFLHPAEAVHGDLGRFTGNDIVLLLSNSGETEEMLKLLPFIKRMGCPIISLTSRPDSSLAKHSDIVIPIGERAEAGSLGLAPTTSTTTMLALGDALAMAVQHRQNFTREQFALFHPGGNLGRSLLLVSEVMRGGEEHCLVNQEMPLRDVLSAITSTKGRPGAATVIDAEGRLQGVFTDGDLRRVLSKAENSLDVPVSNYMGTNPKTIYADQLVQEAMRIMSQYQIDQLIVVDRTDRPIGMIDIQDLMAIRMR